MADIKNEPKKILVIRSSAIGDIVFSSPFAAALRRTYPDAYIAWLVEPGIDQLLQSNPYIDELILWPKREWQALLKKKKLGQFAQTLKAYGKMLKSHQFDWAIDLQSLLKSGVLTKMTQAPRCTGLGSTEGSQYLMTEVFPKGGDITRISSEYLYLAQQLHLDVGDFMPELFLPEASMAVAQKHLQHHGLTEKNYAVIAPFTTRPQKHWFEDAWCDLIRLMQERFKLKTLILGAQADEEKAARMVAAVDSAAISMAGKTSLTESAALVKQAGLLVGVDTGMTHMSIAFNIPSVILFGATCPYTNTCRPHSHVLWLGMSCSPCKRSPICGGTYPCMRYMTADRVLKEVEVVLEKKEN